MLDILIKYLQALFFAFLVSHHQKQTIHGQIPQAGGALVIPLWLAPAVSRPALRQFLSCRLLRLLYRFCAA